MTVLVTGAAGHLGGNLVRALLASGRCICALVHRDRRSLAGLDVETVSGDIRDPASLRRAFEGVEVVYHAAGYVSILGDEWQQLYAINVEGTRNVVEACLQCGVRRLIHFSSIHALDLAPEGGPVDELRPLVQSAHAAPYSLSKAEGEREIRKAHTRGLDTVILYPTALLGPHDYAPSHQGEMLLALARRRLPALVNGGFDWVDVRDVAEGALQAEACAPQGARYILSGHWASARDLALAVEAITGVRAPRLVCPMFLAHLAAPLITVSAQLIGVRPLFTDVALQVLRSNRDMRHDRATRELGYEPRPLRETLLDTLQWFAQTGRLGSVLRPLSPEAT
jgi:dihydroflavonol-4-reductase